MAFQLAEAYVQLGQRGFSGLMGKIGGIKQGLGGIASFATGPLGVALAGLGAGAGAAGMISLAAKAEQTTTQFKTLLGSVDEAESMVRSLQSFAASTPFQFDGLAESAKTLLAFGTSSEQIVPTLQVLGDVSAATGNQVGELANIFGKVKARGALMTESLDQFNERAVPVGAKLAEMFGKTDAEIRKMASEGKISFGDLQAALTEMTQTGGMAFGGMQSQSQTLGGLWSTLKDNITLAMTDIGGAMVEGFSLKDVTANITEFVQRIRSDWMPSIVEGFQWMSTNIIKPVMGAIGQMANVVFDFVSNFDLYWKLAHTHVANAMLNAWESVSTFFKNSVTLGGWFFSNIFNIFSNIYKNAGRIFGDLVKHIQGLWKTLIDFFKTGKLEFNFAPLADAFMAVVEDLPMPNLAKAQLDQMKPEFDAIQREFDRRAKAKEAASQAAGNAQASSAKMDIDQTASSASSASKKSDKASFGQSVGVAQLAEKFQQQIAANKNKKEEMRLAERQARAAEGMAGQAQGQGLRVVVVGGGSVEVPPHGFGGQS